MQYLLINQAINHHNVFNVIGLFTGSIDVTWQPEKERVVNQLGEEEAQGKFHDSLLRKK
jgi:hypothetical protein